MKSRFVDEVVKIDANEPRTAANSMMSRFDFDFCIANLSATLNVKIGLKRSGDEVVECNGGGGYRYLWSSRQRLDQGRSATVPWRHLRALASTGIVTEGATTYRSATPARFCSNNVVEQTRTLTTILSGSTLMLP